MSDTCTHEDCARPQTEESTLCRVHQLRTQIRTGTEGVDASLALIDETAPPKPAAKKRAPRKTTAKKATPKKAEQ